MYSNYFTCPECGIEFEVTAEPMLGRPDTPLSMKCPPCTMPGILYWRTEEGELKRDLEEYRRKSDRIREG